MVAMALESDARKTSSAHSSIDSFLKTRRDSAGCALVFALMELEIALPDEAFYHPYIRDLIVIIQDISVMANVSEKSIILTLRRPVSWLPPHRRSFWR